MSRYSYPPIAAVWHDDKKIQRWLLVEAAIARAGVPHGVPVELPNELEALAQDYYDLVANRALELERQTGHDVVGFIEATRLRLTDNAARWLHWGATSSDVTDTALAMVIREVQQQLNSTGQDLVRDLCRRGLDWRELKRLARTHGQAAMVTSAGRMPIILAGQIDTALAWANATSTYACGKMSGPVGDYPFLHWRKANAELARLGVGVEYPGSTQVVGRDILAQWASALAAMARAVEQFATWVRFESVSGVDQLVVHQPDGYRGSSAMPHKNNPTRAETLCGLSRVVVNGARAIEDSVVLWADRDISHSSVERVELPLITETLGYMLQSARQLVADLSWQEPVGPFPNSFTVKTELVRDGYISFEGHITQAETDGEIHPERDEPLWAWAKVVTTEVPAL